MQQDPLNGLLSLPEHPFSNSEPELGGFFRFDYLYLTLNPPDTAEIGDPASEGILFVNGLPVDVQNSLDTGFVDASPSSGERYEFGYTSGGRGWMGTVTRIDQQQSISSNGVTVVFNDPQGLLLGYADGIDDDINGNNIYGRNGEDLSVDDGAGGFTNPPFDGTIDAVAPADLGDLLTWIITFGELSATTHTEMSGLELMATRRYGRPHTGRYHDLFYGFRYVDLTDSFGISGTGGLYDSSDWDTTVENLIIGPQIGARVVRQWHRFSLTGDARVLLGANFQSASQVGKTGTNGSPGGQNQPVNLFPTSFIDSHSETLFSPVAEWRVEASYFVAHWLSLRCGYTGMYMGNIGRASSRMNYTLPDFGLVNNSANEGVFFNALTLGIEITRQVTVREDGTVAGARLNVQSRTRRSCDTVWRGRYPAAWRPLVRCHRSVSAPRQSVSSPSN